MLYRFGVFLAVPCSFFAASMNLTESSDGGYLLWENAENEKHLFVVDKVLCTGSTPFQDYAIIHSPSHGKLLVIDGELQSSQSDEHVYHECLVQPAMVAHPNPENILIIGAGEGASAREVLRHPSVKKVVMVDIDKEIIEQVRLWLGEWHEGSFDHPKCSLLIVDGKEYVENTEERFDVVIIDICDKLEDNCVVELYSENFYKKIKNILNPEGVVVVQSMEIHLDDENDPLMVYHNLKKVFPYARPYAAYIPSFWSTWGYCLAANRDLDFSAEQVDKILANRSLTDSLQYYDGNTHTHIFSFPKPIRKALN